MVKPTSPQQQRVSIALATYNGAAYLPAQLDSYLAQTRLPDELVVGDDGSTDGTLALLDAFAARAPFTVRITRNPETLGPSGNFIATLLRCSGDVIFPSDQDDVWRADKIARMLEFLCQRPQCWLAAHDAALVDGAGHPLGPTMGGQIDRVRGESAEQGLIAGCCLALDRRLVRLFDAAPAGIPHHDSWLAAAAEQLGLRAYLAEPLIDYRRHGANVSTSYMSDSRAPGILASFGDRWRRARVVPVAQALKDSIVARTGYVAAFRAHRSEIEGVVAPERIDEAIAEQMLGLRRDRARLAYHLSRRRARPGLLVEALQGGAYRGSGGLISLGRDLSGLFDAPTG